MDRKLASVRKIVSIEPIEGADNIVKAVVDGWEVVTQKSNGFKPGDLVVYFEIDSFLPVTEQFEFLRKGCYRNTENLGEGFRIKTIKLRGQVSQGLILPLTEFAQYSTHDCNWYLPYPYDIDYIVEGYDLTVYLKVKKYEAPIPACLSGVAKGNFPSFLRKTDSERAQNLLKDIKRHMNEPFEVTTKLDGSSMTVYCRSHPDLAEPEIGVCSRNLDLVRDETNSFWRVALRDKLPELLLFMSENGYDTAFQGELIGPGIQKNKEKLTDLEFRLFNMFDIKLNKYLSCEERIELVDRVYEKFSLTGCKLLHVPVIHKSITLQELLEPENDEQIMSGLVELSKGPMMNGEGHREGIVFKHLNSDFNFKVINPNFLLKYDE